MQSATDLKTDLDRRFVRERERDAEIEIENSPTFRVAMAFILLIKKCPLPQQHWNSASEGFPTLVNLCT